MIIRRIWNASTEINLNLIWQMRRAFSVSSQSAVDLASKDAELRVFIVAGEVSGDTIGSRVMNSLTKLSPLPVRFAGVGGKMMCNQGFNSLFPMEDIAVMGIWELLPYLNQFRVRLKQTIEAALSFRPHIVLTVDSKGFSFRFLKHLRATCVQQGMVSPLHFHYVSPSFWAWKGGEARLKGLLQFVDHVLCILPFEAEVCRSNGLAATFVGHPTLEDISDFQGKDATERRYRIQGNAEAFLTDYGISSGSPVISLLPGSRLQEVTRMFPIFSRTLQQLKGSFPDVVTAVHVAPNQHVEDYISKAVCKWPSSVVLVPGGSHQMKYNSFSASSVALCTSGTVAMEMQLARLPCVVAYRAHLLTELFIRYKAIIPYISLPNILLDSAVIPEALFQDCTPSKLASLLKDLIVDDNFREKQIIAAEKVFELLRPPEMNISCSIQGGMSVPLSDCTPSMVAANAMLYSRGKLE
ncbi:putative lipid-A-disaccharide synthase, mitochondrial [Nicotiana tabacum]|uniref:lipid-A-disaccharide synthase n=1 Tax=Nicotiana tabacum TaxID=4097 RepID=A0A1S3XGG0_TOBAC|nr:PREDICTED: probable lipid-A-disaccharide synthase, mitochondrial [Nicotiana tabacum]XP_016439031.1 PREDICTED: probable lipid-A-disaccharide synthase, mitochondrial [Nicotiana tabacum]